MRYLNRQSLLLRSFYQKYTSNQDKIAYLLVFYTLRRLLTVPVKWVAGLATTAFDIRVKLPTGVTRHRIRAAL